MPANKHYAPAPMARAEGKVGHRQSLPGPPPAPGARVEIRDAEWVVRRVDPSSDGGYQLTCDGISELVRGTTALFLTALDRVTILDPATTQLVQDQSNAFEQSLLYIESQLRQATPNDEQIHVAHKAAMNHVPYQFDPVMQALKQPRQRILIADAVGLGKTLEAGILVTELMQRGRGKRILVLTLKSMMTQFQKEFWNRFTIPLTRLDSNGLQRVRNRIPGNHNPFYYYDKSIISIDTLKQDNEFKHYLEQAYWDIIVIDEAHNVADRGTSSRRTELAQLLASRSDTLIMLSATPHDGRARSFASLMNMLDPTAIADPEEYSKGDFTSKGLVIRRFKKDIQKQVDEDFRERRVYRLRHDATAEEEAAYEELLAIPFTYNGRFDPEKQGHLIRIGLQKALFSSPAACKASVEERIKKLRKTLESTGDNEDIQSEIDALGSLLLALSDIDGHWSKYDRFIKLLKSEEFGWTANDKQDRLVIFSERLETLRFLEEQLKKTLKLQDNQITQLHGGMSDIEQQEIVENFGKPEEALRVLLCSDVASEGINLHYLSHRLIHFDLPWSLMVFQQRNGRVDRYGQQKDPCIYYLITQSRNGTIRGDTRILEILQEKDDQAEKNIGDPATFMGVYDIDKEEERTAEAMATGISPEAFDTLNQPDKEPNEADDLLSQFMSGALTEADTTSSPPPPPLVNAYSLYGSDYQFIKKAFEFLNRQERMSQVSCQDDSQTISLVAPDDLRERFRFLPHETWPEDGNFILTANREDYEQEIRRSRNDEQAWPKMHYLWRRHPVIEWLQERMLSNTGRHEALVLGLNRDLTADQSIFLVSALIPNRKAHPVIWSWYAVHCTGKTIVGVEPLQKTLESLALGEHLRPNSLQPVDMERLNNLRQPVVDRVRKEVLVEQAAFKKQMDPRLQQQLDELEKLRHAQENLVEKSLENSRQGEGFKKHRRQKRMEKIGDVFTQYRHWVEETLETEPTPYIQLIAVLASCQPKVSHDVH